MVDETLEALINEIVKKNDFERFRTEFSKKLKEKYNQEYNRIISFYDEEKDIVKLFPKPEECWEPREADSLLNQFKSKKCINYRLNKLFNIVINSDVNTSVFVNKEIFPSEYRSTLYNIASALKRESNAFLKNFKPGINYQVKY